MFLLFFCLKKKSTFAGNMKKIICLILVALTVMPLFSEGRKKVAVVLSGGGAKGVAHIGALKVIEKAGLPIDFITGTSMGSLVGGLYAIGYDAQSLDSLVRGMDWNSRGISIKLTMILSHISSQKTHMSTLTLRLRMSVSPSTIILRRARIP